MKFRMADANMRDGNPAKAPHESDTILAKALCNVESGDVTRTRDWILETFLDYVSSLGIELYPTQEEAVLELLEHRHVVLETPTGSGKSLVAFAMHFMALAENCRSVYTCPIKALVNEKFIDLCDVFGPERVGLLTGDASVNRDAPVICCTAEILANMALRGDRIVDYVVMDEFHYYGDKDRGSAWQVPLITMQDTVFLLMSATLGDVSRIASLIEGYTSRKVSVCSGGERPVPLRFEYRESLLHEAVSDLVSSGEAPVYLVNFTQRDAVEQAQALTSLNLCTKEEKKRIADQIKQFKFDTPFGKVLKRLLNVGVGVHHAGLLPKYRLLVERLSHRGMLKVVSGTDSLGVGINIPLRTVVFTRLFKYDGEKTRILTAREFHQIAGRAGRKGFDDHGNVVVLAPQHAVENKRISLKLAKQPHLKNKLRKKKPPEKGFKNWDKGTFQRLLSSAPEQLAPVLDITHGMLISALQGGQSGSQNGYARIVSLIEASHGTGGNKKRLRRKAKILFRELVDAGIVVLEKSGSGTGLSMRVNDELQASFSLHHTLSLYLVETLDLLDHASEERGLNVLSLVEAILDDPVFILRMQEKKVKDELIARLKAQGVGYEERMARLDEVERPAPLKDFLEETFEAFSKLHPWVKEAGVSPKSVARDMYENGFDFNGYVRELGIMRAEGTLLRYLSQVYQTGTQNVPVTARDDVFDDVLSFFRTMLELVDSSLLDEWEAMKGKTGAEETDFRSMEPTLAEKLSRDRKALAARVRNELYMLQSDLKTRDFVSACTRIVHDPDDPWSPERFEQEMAPYFEEHHDIVLTHVARLPANTVIQGAGPVFTVQQKIVDPEGDGDWALFGEVTLGPDVTEDRPLVKLLRIGV